MSAENWSIRFADAVRATILNTTRKLAPFPLSGRIVPELGDESIREWFAYSYRIIYRVENDVVTIAAIIHGKRLLDVE